MPHVKFTPLQHPPAEKHAQDLHQTLIKRARCQSVINSSKHLQLRTLREQTQEQNLSLRSLASVCSKHLPALDMATVATAPRQSKTSATLQSPVNQLASAQQVRSLKPGHVQPAHSAPSSGAGDENRPPPQRVAEAPGVTPSIAFALHC